MLTSYEFFDSKSQTVSKNHFFSPLSHSNSRGPPPRDGQWGPDIRRRTSMVQARLQSPDIVRRRKFGPAERTFSSSLVQNFKFLPTGGAQLTLVLESWRHTILGVSLRTRLIFSFLNSIWLLKIVWRQTLLSNKLELSNKVDMSV